jgi:hypothetical protein
MQLQEEVLVVFFDELLVLATTVPALALENLLIPPAAALHITYGD